MDAGMISNSTLEYYNSHATEYAETTNRADMSDNYSRFLRFLKPGASIVELGCGGGRQREYSRL